jgi:hypothetical protein
MNPGHGIPIQPPRLASPTSDPRNERTGPPIQISAWYDPATDDAGTAETPDDEGVGASVVTNMRTVHASRMNATAQEHWQAMTHGLLGFLVIIAIACVIFLGMVVMRYRRIPFLSTLFYGLSHITIHENGGMDVESGGAFDLKQSIKPAEHIRTLIPRTKLALISKGDKSMLMLFDEDQAKNDLASNRIREGCPGADWIQTSKERAMKFVSPVT